LLLFYRLFKDNQSPKLQHLRTHNKANSAVFRLVYKAQLNQSAAALSRNSAVFRLAYKAQLNQSAAALRRNFSPLKLNLNHKPQ
jgi:hypothetical protein